MNPEIEQLQQDRMGEEFKSVHFGLVSASLLLFQAMTVYAANSNHIEDGQIADFIQHDAGFIQGFLEKPYLLVPGVLAVAAGGVMIKAERKISEIRAKIKSLE